MSTSAGQQHRWSVYLAMGLGALLLCAYPGALWAQDAPPPEETQPADGEGHSGQLYIGEVTLNCDLPRCEEDAEYQRLLSLSELAPGKVFQPEMLESAACYLGRTGFFEAGGVSVRVEEFKPDEVSLIIDTQPQTFIRNVEIDDESSLASDIEQRVFMRSGNPWTGDVEEIQRQREAILTLLEREGYSQAQVNITTQEVGSYLVDLSISIDRGQRLDVRRVYIRGNKAFTYQELRNTILDSFGFIRTYTEGAFSEGVDEVLDMYREAGYIRARATTEATVSRPEDSAVDLFLEIREGPHWSFEVSGNEQFTDDELLEQLSFRTTGFIDSASLESSAGELESFYLTEGFYFAQVRVREEVIDDNERVVNYWVSEGPRAEIRSISFEGNTVFSDDELADLVATQEYTALSAGGFLQPAELEADIRNIEAAYVERGYLWASVPRWTVVALNEGEMLHITLFISEGDQIQIHGIRFDGNRVVNDSSLSAAQPISSGDPFGPQQVDASRAAILREYDHRGYRAQVESVCFHDGVEQSCDQYARPESCEVFDPDRCTDRTRGDIRVQECTRLMDDPACLMPDDLPDRVAIRHQITEGELLTVGEIFIAGNYQTSESVLRRELPLRVGDPFDRSKLTEGQGNIRSLGLFDSVSVTTIGVSQEQCAPRNRVALVIKVEEGSSRSFEVREGLTGQNELDNQFLLLNDFEWIFSERNFLGLAAELRAGQSIEFDLTNLDQWSNCSFFDDCEYIISGEVTYIDPRFYWWDLTDQYRLLEFGLFGLIDQLSEPQQQREVALSFSTTREFERIEGLFFTSEARLSFVQTRRVAEQQDFEDAVLLKFSPRLTMDRRDNPINPREGYRTEFRLDLADDFLPDRESFSRVELSGTGFVPLGNSDFIFAAHIRFGFAFRLAGLFKGEPFAEDASLPLEDRLLLTPSERFQLGGASNLRGFPEASLGPQTGNQVPSFGDVVLNGSFELRYPLIESISLDGAYFVDWGQLQADFGDFSAQDFRFTTGLGLRLIAFDLVPILFDYGLVLNRRIGESIGQLHFNVGYTF
ncbi:MAG: BamA/TamA family outer membrane protein [Myxococcales bacterium]|nr:BamA/TamA family outer membrane protein [Myxococcales bacterium]